MSVKKTGKKYISRCCKNQTFNFIHNTKVCLVHGEYPDDLAEIIFCMMRIGHENFTSPICDWDYSHIEHILCEVIDRIVKENLKSKFQKVWWDTLFIKAQTKNLIHKISENFEFENIQNILSELEELGEEDEEDEEDEEELGEEDEGDEEEEGDEGDESPNSLTQYKINLVKYIHRKYEEDKKLQLKKFNVVFLGDKAVGKTTFIKRHLTGKFEKVYKATDKIENSELRFYSPDSIFDLNILDCPGDEKFKDFDWKEIDAAVLFFDVTSRETYKNIPSWYNSIRTKITGPIVLVGNKCDCIDRKVSPRYITIHDKYNIKYYDISAASNYNFEKPFICLLQQLTGNPSLTIL